MFSTSKVKKEQKLRVGATRQNLHVQPKSIIKWPEHQINQSNRKKYIKYLKSGKEPKIPMEATRQNSPGGLKNNKTQVEFKKS
jgi:hypothetical protein